MNPVFTIGRVLFASAVVALGLEQLIKGDFSVGLLPFPPAFPGRYIFVLMLGLVLIIAGMSIGFLRRARVSALGLGILFLGLTLYLHVPTLLTNPRSGNTWTVFAELLAFSGGALYIAGGFQQTDWRLVERQFNWTVLGKYFFVVALLIFGMLHFIYAAYIATLIPPWIPARLFWAYFVGVAFCGTALSLLLNRYQTLSTGLLGLMFFLWVVLLHAPRVVKNPQIEPEWTSLLIALAMSGLAFLMTGNPRQKGLPILVNRL